MYFSFSVIFSFLAIYQIFQCAFLIFHFFQWFCHFSRRQVDVSLFPWFSVFFAIFHVLKCVFLIFRDFQFSCHIPRPTVDISKFSNFFSFLRRISRPKGCISHFLWFSVFSPYTRSFSVHFSFFTFFSDFVIFQGVKWMFLFFHDFQFSSPYFTS